MKNHDIISRDNSAINFDTRNAAVGRKGEFMLEGITASDQKVMTPVHW